jgi:hypothetical protein
MRIWDEMVSDSRGVLSWSIGKQGEGLAVFEVSSGTFSSCFKVPYKRRGISDLRKEIADQHRVDLEEIGRAAFREGSVLRVNRVGMDDPHYAIDDDVFRRLAAQRGFDWRR